MDWAKSIEYSVDYKRPHYVVMLSIIVKRGILIKIAEKTNVEFKDEEIIKVPSEKYVQFKPILNKILDAVEKKIKDKHDSFQFFSVDIKDIFLEKLDDKFYVIKVYIEGITPYD